MTKANIANFTQQAKLQDQRLILTIYQDYLSNTEELEHVIHFYTQIYNFTKAALSEVIKAQLLARSLKLIQQKELVLGTSLISCYWGEEEFNLKIDKCVAKFMARKIKPRQQISAQSYSDKQQEPYAAEDYDEIAAKFNPYLKQNESLLLEATKNYLFTRHELKSAIKDQFNLNNPDADLVRDLFNFIREEILEQMLSLVAQKKLTFGKGDVYRYFANEEVEAAIGCYIEKFILTKLPEVNDVYNSLLYPQSFAEYYIKKPYLSEERHFAAECEARRELLK